MLSPEGQKELRAFADRVQARVRTEVSAAPSRNQPGALQLESLSTRWSVVEIAGLLITHRNNARRGSVS